jgi:hypothetical protein
MPRSRSREPQTASRLPQPRAAYRLTRIHNRTSTVGNAAFSIVTGSGHPEQKYPWSVTTTEPNATTRGGELLLRRR